MKQDAREQIFLRLKEKPEVYQKFLSLNEEWKERFLEFCEGKKTLPLTYEPMFQTIFNFDVHPERLSRLISALLRQKVVVVQLLPRESSLITGKNLLILDVLARAEDSSLINVEIQKQGYYFPAERISCYSSDLVMRQYALVKSKRGSEFTYRDLKKVYVIVIYEKSTKEFHAIKDSYIHYGKTVFDTGLGLELLQEYCLISLDVFRQFQYPKDKDEQSVWLSLLATEDLYEAEQLIQRFPWTKEIFQEIALLREKPEEVLNMFSDALRILDENTLAYMIEDMQKQTEEMQKQMEQIKLETEKIKIENEESKKIAEENKKAAEENKRVAEENKRVAEENKKAAEKERIGRELAEAEVERLRRQLEEMRRV